MNKERKAALIERYHDINVSHDWWDAVYEDFESVCKILGIELDATKYGPDIMFSGFWSQGDGASWAGAYYAERWDRSSMHNLYTYDTAPARIREYAPKDEELHRIADELCFLARIYYPAYARVTRLGYYCHSGTMHLAHYRPMDESTDEGDFADEVHRHVEDTLTDLFRDLADWLYARLEQEYNYLTSDEAVWDTIEANELDEEEEEV
jgi:hypothetical protein